MDTIKITSRQDSSYKLSKILNDQSNKLWTIINATNLKGLSEFDQKILMEMENLITKKSSDESLSEFEQWKNQTIFVDLNNISKLAGQFLERDNFNFDRILPISGKSKVSIEITAFYNFMSNFLDISDLLIIFFSFSSRNIFSTTLGEVFVGNNHQCVVFTNGWAINPICSIQYNRGFYAAKTNFSTFVHEFCHGLLGFLSTTSINSKTRSKFNRVDVYNNIGKNYETCKELINDKKNRKTTVYPTYPITDDYKNYIYNSYFNDYITNKILINEEFSKENIKKLINMTAVPSEYGRSNMDKLPEELLCEAFAYWYCTPENERNYYWELIHHYFSKIIWDKWYYNK